MTILTIFATLIFSMDNNKVLKGVLFVGLGASFYGMLTTFVKLAYHSSHHYTTAEVTTAQFSLGILGLIIINFIQSKITKKKKTSPTRKDFWKLILTGTSFGGTSLFYYLSVQFVDVSIGIVLLMQSVWLSVVVESFLEKKFPNKRKVIATLIVLIGTVFATNALNSDAKLNPIGIFWGLLAAVSYTITMFTSNKIATYLSPSKKSLIMLFGGSILVGIFLFISQVGPVHFEFFKDLYLDITNNPSSIRPFDCSIFYTYGLILAVFGTILPPILLNKGFPNAGLGLGSIVSSMELPVSVSFAYLLLHEQVAIVQWLGILLILLAVVLMNLKTKKTIPPTNL